MVSRNKVFLAWEHSGHCSMGTFRALLCGYIQGIALREKILEQFSRDLDP